jgi:hypothetical protein
MGVRKPDVGVMNPGGDPNFDSRQYGWEYYVWSLPAQFKVLLWCLRT